MSSRQNWSRVPDVDLIRLGQLAVPVVIVAVWHLAAVATTQFALASPLETFTALLTGIRDGWIIEGFTRTMTELAVAFVLAAVTGVWLGVTLGLDEFWHDVFEPVLLSTYAIPKVTLFPLFLFIFQFGLDSKIAFGWFHGVFPIAILTMNATATVNDIHLKVGRSLQLSRWQIFRSIVVPSILPSLVTGLRLGFNLTFLGIILGEMFASRAGLGYTLVELITGAQVARMLAIVTVLILIATLVNVVFFVIEGKLSERDADTINAPM